MWEHDAWEQNKKDRAAARGQIVKDILALKDNSKQCRERYSWSPVAQRHRLEVWTGWASKYSGWKIKIRRWNHQKRLIALHSQKKSWIFEQSLRWLRERQGYFEKISWSFADSELKYENQSQSHGVLEVQCKKWLPQSPPKASWWKLMRLRKRRQLSHSGGAWRDAW